MLVELVIDGRHRHGADALLDRYAGQGAHTLLTAAQGLIEATSALRSLVLRADISPDEGRSGAEWLGELDIALDATAPRLRRIWELRDSMSAYDAAYAAAAEALEAPLMTTDNRLLRACRSRNIDASHLDDLAGRAGG